MTYRGIRCDLDRFASLAPNAEITVSPWKEPEELKQRTINRVRGFLKAHVPNSTLRRYAPAAQ
jgi:hypothetical protein